MKKNTVLVVDDNNINRKVLSRILMEDYEVIQAANGREALEALSKNKVTAVMLDLVMPIMNGYEFLQSIQGSSKYNNIPIIVSTGNSDKNNEKHALELGAWDFISKPYDAAIIKFRLKNAIDRSFLETARKLEYVAKFDVLTDIYNKTTFFSVIRDLVSDASKHYVFVRIDIDQFKLINSLFGVKAGDNLLKYIANTVQNLEDKYDIAAYGRIESDVFGLCVEQDDEKISAIIEECKNILVGYSLKFVIKPSFGICPIEALTEDIENVYIKATLAAKECKNQYRKFSSYYVEELGNRLIISQQIMNDSKAAIEEKQFIVYFQPKYNAKSQTPHGAEALVRWQHPEKGLISPGVFIPVFEQNGFINELDYYVWDRVCQHLHEWVSAGFDPAPVSVNISRASMYNPRLVELLCELVEKYDISPELLNLEVTESAYIDNPDIIVSIIDKLHQNGFLVMMDDFGSGYSSLNMLKDLKVDVLKIDTNFISDDLDDENSRGGTILQCVIQMAKRLNMIIIVEGVEKKEQYEFLNKLGCEYIQGFYFARPMPVDKYIEVIS